MSSWTSPDASPERLKPSASAKTAAASSKRAHSDAYATVWAITLPRTPRAIFCANCNIAFVSSYLAVLLETHTVAKSLPALPVYTVTTSA